MKKLLPTLALALLFLVPTFSYAATLDETRHSMLLQLISLIQQEITILQAQLAAQQANAPLGAVSSPTDTSVTDQIATITQQLGSTMPDTVPFDLFTGAVQPHFVSIVTNHPVASILGENVTSYSEVNGDTVFRNQKTDMNTPVPAYTYEVLLQNFVKGVAFDLVITDTEGTAITKSLSL